MKFIVFFSRKHISATRFHKGVIGVVSKTPFAAGRKLTRDLRKNVPTGVYRIESVAPISLDSEMLTKQARVARRRAKTAKDDESRQVFEAVARGCRMAAKAAIG